MKSRSYDRKNPEFASAHTGVEANHSSAVPSTDSSLDHAQSDDAINDIPLSDDPNISGTDPTTTPYTWLAGKLDGWMENDDYRTFFANSRGCDGMLGYDSRDMDYDDNGGIPLATGNPRGMVGEPGHIAENSEAAKYSIGPVVMRRI